MIESAKLGTRDHVQLLALDSRVVELGTFQKSTQITTMSHLLESVTSLENAVRYRNKAETIFTIGPSFIQSVMDGSPEGAWVVYADADIEFHKPLSMYLATFPNSSVVIAPHRHYWWNRRRLAKFGEFNVGVVAFRNDIEGRLVLSNWAQACLDWCLDQPINGKYADQKYLEDFSHWSDKVVVDSNLGTNLAPWNASYLGIRGEPGNLFVGGARITYFHHQGLRRTSKRWHLGHLPYLAAAGPSLKSKVYLPYLAKLEEAQKRLGLEAAQSSVRPSSRFVARALQDLGRIASFVLGQTISIKKIGRYAAKNTLK